MANFIPPFADVGEKRFPTLTEKQQGHGCGEADRALFNGLQHRLEAEVGHVIAHAGLTGSDADMQQLRKAIQALISAATGGGDTSQFLLTSQARARLPLWPDIAAVSGVATVSAPSTGVVRLAAGSVIMHRGILPYTTVQTDFNTDASKTYHLRMNMTTGVVTLNDLANATYNPTAAAETSALFDSTYDDALLARIVTNSSNVATITALVNRNRFWTIIERTTSLFLGAGNYGASQLDPYTYNLARTPRINLQGYNVGVTADYRDSQEMGLLPQSVTRYGCNIFNYTVSEGAGGNYAFPYRFSVEI